MRFLNLALVEHDPLALGAIAWGVVVLVYVVLQAWFIYAWTARWRAVALIALLGPIATAALFLFMAATIPEAPPAFELNSLVAYILDGVLFFAPIGLIYLVVPGIVHRMRSRPTRADADYRLPG